MYIPGVDDGITLVAPTAQASPRGYLAMGDENNAGRARSFEAQRPKAGDEKPFDAWLRKQLHAMYDEIAAEPLPTDLIELIDRDTMADSGEQESLDPKMDQPSAAIKKDES